MNKGIPEDEAMIMIDGATTAVYAHNTGLSDAISDGNGGEQPGRCAPGKNMPSGLFVNPCNLDTGKREGISMERIVYNAAELEDAVGPGNDYDYIYLGNDIQITIFGMRIDPNKTTLVIDGFHDETIHTLEDANIVTAVGTIGIRAESNITVTFKNMIMTGRNYYGMPFVDESANTEGVTVIYENVTYTGPQITFNPNGLTRYIDCDITISYPTYPSRTQETGEVNRVEFKGKNTIRHYASNDDTKAVFWFRGTVGTAYLKVLENAEVTISTTNYFMYSRTPVIPTTDNPVAFIIEPNASFTLTSNRGISYRANHLASSFLVDTGASFRYIQETANDSTESLYLNGEFTVNEGADFYMQADFDNARPLINFAEGSDFISVNSPKSFVLYNRASSVITVEPGNTARPFLISGGQLNQWNEASSLPGAGDINDGPYRKWNRPSWSNFSIEGSLTPLETIVDSTTFTPEELAELPELEDLSFQDARVVSIGSLPILPDIVADDGRPISGYTDPGASMLITYTIAGDDYSFELTADEDGNFSVVSPVPLTVGTDIEIKANIPFLITIIEITVVADEIIIESSPVRISFRIPPISTDPYVLLRRINPEEPVQVLDSRGVGTEWELLASISGPLTTASGEVSGNAVIFKDTNGVISELSTTPVVVYEGGPATGRTRIFWPVEEGILIRVTEPIRSGVEYTTELNWEIRIIT